MKVQRIYESSLEINFNSPAQEFSLYRASFLQLEIDPIYQAISMANFIKYFTPCKKRKGRHVF